MPNAIPNLRIEEEKKDDQWVRRKGRRWSVGVGRREAGRNLKRW